MQKVIQFGFATLFWGVVLMFSPEFVVKVYGVAILPVVCAVFALLGTMFPSLFQMGVQGFKKANIIEKAIPILLVMAICFGTSLMPQTYASAMFLSLLIGNTTSYLGYLIGGFCK